MKKLIDQFPQHIDSALDIAFDTDLSHISDKKYKNVIIIGMGGSGIGGHLIKSMARYSARVPISIVQDYRIPAYVNEDTLVICCSYSGNTEETISAYGEALKVNANIVSLCSGGKLSTCLDSGAKAVIKIPKGIPPRGALAYSLVLISYILVQCRVAPAQLFREVTDCKEFLLAHQTDIMIEAKQLANFMYKKETILYTVPELEAVCVRGRQQFNENSKVLCWHHTIPEMNHNELVGWTGASSIYAAVFMHSDLTHPKNKKRIKISEKIIRKRINSIYHLFPKGDSIIQENLYHLHTLDYASYYLSELNEQDPIDISVIEYLKTELTKA